METGSERGDRVSMNAPPSMASSFFEVLSGSEPGQVLPLLEQTVTIGRDPRNTFTMKDEAMSREHAKVFWRGGQHFVVDLNSSHGTWVNKQRITCQALLDQDQVRLGQTVLRYVLEGATQNSPTSEAAQPEPASDFTLEMPDDELVADRREESGSHSGLTPDGEDPFADDEDVFDAAHPSAPPALASPARSSSREPSTATSPRHAALPSRSAPPSRSFLHQDLDQRGTVTRWLAVLLAVILTAGLGYGAMKLVSSGDDEEAAPSSFGERNRGPIR